LLAAQAQQAGQATRGRQMYAAQCASCHGAALQGTSGPPLAGGSFLANWSGQPLANLVDKIQKTMPFGQPGSLTRSQSIDLAAYVLETANVSTGAGGLTEAKLAQITFPAVQAPASPPLEGNLAEFMRAIAFPSSNIVFNVQIKDPSTQTRRESASTPFDYFEWGNTVYPGWLAVDQAALALIETTPLLLAQGRRCQNGRLAPVDRADWQQYVADLAGVARLAYQASKARNREAFFEISEKLDAACANCHKVYRDKGGTEGSGSARCQ
jgi:cytochrome c553